MKRRGLYLLLAGFMVLNCFGCSGRSNAVEDDSTMEGQDITTNVFAGVVVAEKEEDIMCNEGMAISKVYVQAGDEVKEGDILFSYDSEGAKLSYDKAKLELQQLQSELSSSKKALAELNKGKRTAKGDEKLQYTIDVQSTEADILEKEYAIKQKQLELIDLEKAVKNVKVKSPIDGVIKSIGGSDNGQGDEYEGYDDYSGEEGSEGSSGHQKSFIKIIQADSLEVKGTVNELNLSNIYEGMEVTVKSRVNDDTWHGTISRIEYDNNSTGSSSDDMMMNEDGGGNDEMTSSSKYPFYVTLDSQEGLVLGQHLYLVIEGMDMTGDLLEDMSDEMMDEMPDEMVDEAVEE